MHALVIGDNNKRPISTNLIRIGKCDAGSENMKEAHHGKLKDIHCFFVGLISKNIKGEPLYGMEDNNGQSKACIVNSR